MGSCSSKESDFSILHSLFELSLTDYLIHKDVLELVAFIELKLQGLVQIVSHVEHLCGQLVQLDVVSHILVINHNFVTQLFCSILNASYLPELAWVLFSELPRINHYIAFFV